MTELMRKNAGVAKRHIKTVKPKKSWAERFFLGLRFQYIFRFKAKKRNMKATMPVIGCAIRDAAAVRSATKSASRFLSDLRYQREKLKDTKNGMKPKLLPVDLEPHPKKFM